MQTLTGRMGRHAPAMQNIPRPKPDLEERVLDALEDGNIRTFGQLEVLCGAVNPAHVLDVESFSDRLDKVLQALIATGRVLLVARRPELCFRLGTVLDQIVKGLDNDENASG